MRHLRQRCVLTVLVILSTGPLGLKALGQTLPSSRRNASAALIEVTEPDPQRVAIAVRTHATLMSHGELLTRVVFIKNSAARQTNWFKQMPDEAAACRWLVEHLHVEPVEGTALIRASLDAPLPARDATAILQAIAQTYIDDAQKAARDRVQDRAQSLGNLRIKYETRVRELLDRQQNRMLMLDIGQVGSPNRYTATDIELQELTKKRAELIAEVARQNPSTQPSDAAAAGAGAAAALAAVDARLEQVKQRAGDLAIAMSDYLSITEELAATRAELLSIKNKLDAISSGAANPPVRWAARPIGFVEAD